MLNLFRKKKAAPVQKGEGDEEEETPTEEMKRAQVGQLARDEESVKRQQLDQLVMELSQRIVKEIDGLVQAKLEVEKAKLEVRVAEMQEDAQKQFDAHLAFFKAEKGLTEAKLEKAIAEAKADAAAATSDELRDAWNKKLVAALADSEAFLTALPGELEAKTKELRARFLGEVVRKNITLEELDQMLLEHPFQPKTSMVHPNEQAMLLGDFNNPEHSWNLVQGNLSTWRIDMSLQPSLIGKLRPLADALNAALRLPEDGHHLIIGVSGAGKTSGMTDVARSSYVIFFQCESTRTRTPSKFQDRGYQEMIQLFRIKKMAAAAEAPFTGHTSSSWTEEQRRAHLFEIANRAALEAAKIELVCRFAQLRRLFQCKPDLTPFEYYTHQHFEGDIWMKDIRRELKHLSEDCCAALVKKMRTDLTACFRGAGFTDAKLVIMLDELEDGMSIDDDSFDVPAKAKGFAAVQVQAYDQLMDVGRYHMVYLGTGSSFDRRNTLRSAINKDRGVEVIYGFNAPLFPTVDAAICRLFFSYLNVGDVLRLDQIQAQPSNAKEIDSLQPKLVEAKETGAEDSSLALEVINRFIVNSRFRTLTRILVLLIDITANAPSWSKTRRFTYAVCTSVLGAMGDLMDGFSKHAQSYKDAVAVQGFNNYLLSIWTSMSLMDGKVRFLHETAPTDLTKLGVGNYVGDLWDKDTTPSGYYDIHEPIVLLAVRGYFLQHKEGVVKTHGKHIQAAMAALVSSHGLTPARGTLLEDLVFNSLLREEFQDILVSELPFVKAALEKEKQAKKELRDQEFRRHSTKRAQDNFLKKEAERAAAATTSPPWWEQVRFQATKYARYDGLKEGDTSLTTAQFLKGNRNVVYSPETTARFDGMIMLEEDKSMSFAITMWGEAVPNDKVRSQILSTDPSRAFLKVDGTPNEQCISQRNAWMDNHLDQIGAVRVQVALPRFAEDALTPEVTVTRDSDLLVHLDCTNVHLLLGKDQSGLYDILAAATRTARQDWAIS